MVPQLADTITTLSFSLQDQMFHLQDGCVSLQEQTLSLATIVILSCQMLGYQ